MARLKYGLSGISPGELLAKALHIVSKMTGNANFATPDPTLPVVTTATDELANAIQAALDGGTDRIETRNSKAATLSGLLQDLGAYVQSITKGDAEKILSSGFEIVQRGGPVGNLGVPGNLVPKTSEMFGEMNLDWDPVHGASEYIIEMNQTDPNDQAQWKLVGYSSKSSFTVTGLNSATVYWFRVCALGTSGKGPYSDPARGVTQ